MSSRSRLCTRLSGRLHSSFVYSPRQLQIIHSKLSSQTLNATKIIFSQTLLLFLVGFRFLCVLGYQVAHYLQVYISLINVWNRLEFLFLNTTKKWAMKFNIHINTEQKKKAYFIAESNNILRYLIVDSGENASVVFGELDLAQYQLILRLLILEVFAFLFKSTKIFQTLTKNRQA
jgi:hypothetical protein